MGRGPVSAPQEPRARLGQKSGLVNVATLRMERPDRLGHLVTCEIGRSLLRLEYVLNNFYRWCLRCLFRHLKIKRSLRLFRLELVYSDSVRELCFERCDVLYF